MEWGSEVVVEADWAQGLVVVVAVAVAMGWAWGWVVVGWAWGWVVVGWAQGLGTVDCRPWGIGRAKWAARVSSLGS